ncbi:MAG: hypothetical protein KGM98_03765 [Bacteroidota bacterium]|nr:hypothetical protein [Bacteroidota bacterium]
MEPTNPKVAVVYLIWAPYGVELLQNFVQSYLQYSSGNDHLLVFLFNGFSGDKEVAAFKEVVDIHPLNYRALFSRGGQDLEVYQWAATQLDMPFILFLNSFSVILGPCWLSILMGPMKEELVGVVAPTGSYESYYQSVVQNTSWQWDQTLSWNENFRKYRLLLKATCYWRFLFPPFPNPHFRTSSFLIRRQLFLDLRIGSPGNKFKTYLLESGHGSLTNQALRKGFRILIAGKDGRCFEMDSWGSSEIFWQGNQGNLLISDKQSKAYDQAEKSVRALLHYRAWGNLE